MWAQIATLQGISLRTLGRGEEFALIDVGSNYIIVRPDSSGVERRIPRNQIESAYAELLNAGHLDLKSIRRHSEMNPVYVATILSTLPGVECRNRPKIVLSIRKLS